MPIVLAVYFFDGNKTTKNLTLPKEIFVINKLIVDKNLRMIIG